MEKDEQITPLRLNELLCDAYQRGYRTGVMKGSGALVEAVADAAAQLCKDLPTRESV